MTDEEEPDQCAWCRRELSESEQVYVCRDGTVRCGECYHGVNQSQNTGERKESR